MRIVIIALTLTAVACGRVSRDEDASDATAGASGASPGSGGALPDDPCLHPLHVADCYQPYATYAYNRETGYCQEVQDGGCRDTLNRFASLALCESTCDALPEPTCDDPTERAGGCPCTTTAQCAGEVCLGDDVIPMDPDDCLTLTEGVCRTYTPLLGCWCTFGYVNLPDEVGVCWDGLEFE